MEIAVFYAVKNSDYWSREMLNFDFWEKGLEIVSSPQEKCFSCYILLTDQISLADSVYFLQY